MTASHLARGQMREIIGQLPGDVTVVCADSTFCIHKERLVACGEFFRAAFDERHMFQEAITSTITLPENGETFEFLAFFAYTGSLLSYTNTARNGNLDRELVLSLQVPSSVVDDASLTNEEPTSSRPLDPTLQSIVLLSEVYYMADKYLVTGLQTLCANQAAVLAEVLASKSLNWLPAGSPNLEALGSWIKGVYANTTRFDLALKESVCIYVHQASERARQEFFYPHLQFFFARLLMGNDELRDSMYERAQPPPPTCPGCLSQAGCHRLHHLAPWYIGWRCECYLCGHVHDHALQKEEFEWQPGQWARHERWRMLWEEIVENSNGVEELERMERALNLYRV